MEIIKNLAKSFWLGVLSTLKVVLIAIGLIGMLAGILLAFLCILALATKILTLTGLGGILLLAADIVTMYYICLGVWSKEISPVPLLKRIGIFVLLLFILALINLFFFGLGYLVLLPFSLTLSIGSIGSIGLVTFVVLALLTVGIVKLVRYFKQNGFKRVPEHCFNALGGLCVIAAIAAIIWFIFF